MKTKLLILLIVLVVLTGCKKENKDIRSLNNYKADEVCKKHIVEEDDGEEYSSDSIVYLMYDEFNFVSSAIYQSVSNDANSYSYELYEQLRRLYSSIEGVNVIYYEIKDGLVLEVRYDYDKIDLNTFRGTLGDLLDKNSLLGKAVTIPVTKEKFKNLELDGYECEVK